MNLQRKYNLIKKGVIVYKNVTIQTTDKTAFCETCFAFEKKYSNIDVVREKKIPK